MGIAVQTALRSIRIAPVIYVDCDSLLTAYKIKSKDNPVILVSPNPIEIQGEISIQGTQKYNDLSFVLYDYSGKIVLKEKMNSNPFILNRGDLAAGLYILTVYDSTDFIIGRKKIMLK